VSANSHREVAAGERVVDPALAAESPATGASPLTGTVVVLPTSQASLRAYVLRCELTGCRRLVPG